MRQTYKRLLVTEDMHTALKNRADQGKRTMLAELWLLMEHANMFESAAK